MSTPVPELLRAFGDEVERRIERSKRRARRLAASPAVAPARRAVARVAAAAGVRRRPDEPVEPYVPGVTPIGRLLWRPAVLGFIASVAIFLGGTQPSSPFTLKLPGSWYFGIPGQPAVPGQAAPPGQGLFLGVVAVYAGMLLMLRAWYDLVRIVSRHPGIPVRRLVPIFMAWVVPLLVVAPLFSRDVYSYAAQGEMMTRGINPYAYGTSVLGVTPLNSLVDPLWQNVTSPYGPLFLMPAGWIVAATGHNLLASVVGLRLLALAGTVAFSAAVPAIARSFGRDGASAFALAALNPLVLYNLVAGAHNDALMLGFLVGGYALHRRGHSVLGIVLSACGAAVKVPALIGVLYIGWEWLGPGRSIRQRVRPVATAFLIALATMAVLSEVAGLGWGWMAGLSNPDTVRSWLDPATAIGMASGKLLGAVGLPGHTHFTLTLARGTGLLLAAAIGLRLLLRADEIGPLRALGWSLVAVVVLSPVVQPWYASWGFVFLAPIATGRVRSIVVWASGIACFVGLPGGRVLVNELAASPGLTAAAAVSLIGVAALIVRPRLRPLGPGDGPGSGSPERELASTAG
ncbi:MAG: polyprenol phosphomannose-dependent alpha 1,6 mannosyltransferase MptB [Actinomycetota bacterium]|nr:polyprenol phosphomannose-dependent alpha 1,6 mannosyltransferase MptB [Actinomycetota bacterium]